MHLCRTVLQWMLHPFHITITDDTWFVWEQFIKFALVGCSNAVVTLIVYNIMVLLFGAGIYLYAQTIGYIAGIVNSFFWNSRFVFNSGEQKSAPAEANSPSILSSLSELDPKMLKLMSHLMGEYKAPNNDKTALLKAMKPYLKPERHQALDKAADIVKMAHLAKIALSELGGGDKN